ncbi:hypothetical protein SMU36_08258 [Streptococcus mutans 4VF1]|nr:hypothetical protein SMU36_08258 [Streptococcus mutans 4VF1]EMC33225.1 hypothetical protein SMU89_04320 [Streptococcus mutans NLML1]
MANFNLKFAEEKQLSINKRQQTIDLERYLYVKIIQRSVYGTLNDFLCHNMA